MKNTVLLRPSTVHHQQVTTSTTHGGAIIEEDSPTVSSPSSEYSNSTTTTNNLSTIVELDQMIEHFKKQISYLEKQRERKITAMMCGKSIITGVGGNSDRNFSSISSYIQKILKSAFSESRFYNLFMIELLEMFITQTIVLFGVVCFWRGVWNLSEYYITTSAGSGGNSSENLARLGWSTLMIGVLVSFLTQIGSVLVTRLGILNLLVSTFENDSKMETAQQASMMFNNNNSLSSSSSSTSTSSVDDSSSSSAGSVGGKKQPSLWIRFGMKFYTYIVAVSIILSWKGSWMVMDAYFDRWFKNAFVTNWLTHIVAAVVLVWFYTFRSVLSPASMDRENHFESLIVSKWSGMSRPLVKDWAKNTISKNKDLTEMDA